jgi:hypothetical protein
VRLVVLIVIDQFPSWAFAKQKALFTGGIARLLREGALVPDAELPYASTFTAAGHATISTGAPPRVSGTAGNYWFRRAEGRDHPAEYDGDAPVFIVGEKYGTAEVTSDDGASSRALRVGGVADVLHAATNGAGKSIAVSLKSRAACLVAGKQPDLAIWYEAGACGRAGDRTLLRTRARSPRQTPHRHTASPSPQMRIPWSDPRVARRAPA